MKRRDGRVERRESAVVALAEDSTSQRLDAEQRGVLDLPWEPTNPNAPLRIPDEGEHGLANDVLSAELTAAVIQLGRKASISTLSSHRIGWTSAGVGLVQPSLPKAAVDERTPAAAGAGIVVGV